MPMINVQGTPVHYHLTGTGPAVVRYMHATGCPVDSAARLPYLLSGLITNQNPQEFVAS